jgi:hypothetical protein
LGAESEYDIRNAILHRDLLILLIHWRHLVIRSSYKAGKMTCRVALFFVASPLGTMFAGYTQAAAYMNVDGGMDCLGGGILS